MCLFLCLEILVLHSGGEIRIYDGSQYLIRADMGSPGQHLRHSSSTSKVGLFAVCAPVVMKSGNITPGFITSGCATVPSPMA